MAQLLVLVLVPLAVLGLEAVRTAVARSKSADQAERVEQRAEALLAVIRIGYAVAGERIPVVTELRAGQLGVATSDAAKMIGFDPGTWVQRSRAATDAALAELPIGAKLQTIQELIERARADRDAMGVSVQTDVRLSDAQSSAEARAQQIAAELARQTEGIAGSPAASRDVLALQVAHQASILQSDMAENVFAVTAHLTDERDAGLIGGQPGGIKTARSNVELLRDRLVKDQASYRALATEIDTLGSLPVRSAWHQIRESPDTQELDQSVEDALETPASGKPDVKALVTSAPVFRQLLARQQAHHELVETAGAVVLDDVQALRSAADSAYRTALLQAAGLGLMVLLGAAYFSRGITRPLREIAARANRLRDGDLSFDPAANRGPREVAAIGQAFNDVARNLQLLEDQATALSHGDTHHESLQRRIPGGLGRSLQASVARLSQSIEAREELESRLRHEATHDGLTGLLNRASAIVALEQGVARAHRVGGGLAVLMVDLDGLKRINDASGHSTGDAVLRRAATRLAKSVRSGDIVARLGADEFMVVAEVNGITDAVELGQRIVDDLSGTSADLVSPIVSPRSSAGPPTVAASVGVSITLDGRGTPAALMRDADAAVRRAKDSGGARLELFDEELRRQLAERATIEAALSAAMARGDLELHYQPIVGPDGEMAGLEALCRWTDPVLGEVAPSVFLQVAEASDLVVELDRWVLREATRQLAEWQRSGQLGGVYLSVNLSGRHLLGTGVVGDVRSTLAESGVDPSVLVLEITETVLLDDLLVAAQHLTELRELGIRVAVDDFGTGYTSIAHLQRLPVDIVKIDRLFIADLTSSHGRSLVRLMIDMATTLGLGIVAEGVETPAELEHLKSMGCPLMQGHLLGRPMVPAAIPGWLTTATA